MTAPANMDLAWVGAGWTPLPDAWERGAPAPQTQPHPYSLCAHCERPMADGGSPLPADQATTETDRVCATCWRGYLEFCEEIEVEVDCCEDCGGSEFDGDGMCLTVGCTSKDLFQPRSA